MIFTCIFFLSSSLLDNLCDAVSSVIHAYCNIESTLKKQLKWNNNLKSQARIPAHSVPLMEGVDSKTE